MDSQHRHGEFATGMAVVWTVNLLALLSMVLIPSAVRVLLSSLLIHIPIYNLNEIFIYVFLAAQLTQLPYAIPMYLRFRQQRRFKAAKGVIFGAVVALGINWAAIAVFLRDLAEPCYGSSFC